MTSAVFSYHDPAPLPAIDLDPCEVALAQFWHVAVDAVPESNEPRYRLARVDGARASVPVHPTVLRQLQLIGPFAGLRVYSKRHLMLQRGADVDADTTPEPII
jgi:hypothetical protein